MKQFQIGTGEQQLESYIYIYHAYEETLPEAAPALGSVLVLSTLILSVTMTFHYHL